MPVLFLSHGRNRKAISQTDPEILPVLHGRQLQAGPGVPERCMSILAVQNGKKSGHDEQKGSNLDSPKWYRHGAVSYLESTNCPSPISH
jgi:hypothetical protein